MLFLIEYDRSQRQLVTFKSYSSEQRQEAREARLELELHCNRLRISREIVILEARTEEQIRFTHGRYFYTLEQLLERMVEAINNHPLYSKAGL